MDALSGESELFGALRPFAVGMAVYTAILWVGDLLAITSSGPVSMVLGLLSTLVSLYIAWGVSRAVEDMERTRSADLGAVGLRKAWMVLAVARHFRWYRWPFWCCWEESSGCWQLYAAWWLWLASYGTWWPYGAPRPVMRPCM